MTIPMVKLHDIERSIQRAMNEEVANTPTCVKLLAELLNGYRYALSQGYGVVDSDVIARKSDG